MLCSICEKLSSMPINKNCLRCTNVIFNKLSVLCEQCSTLSKQCAACLKKILSQTERDIARGCNCGKK